MIQPTPDHDELTAPAFLPGRPGRLGGRRPANLAPYVAVPVLLLVMVATSPCLEPPAGGAHLAGLVGPAVRANAAGDADLVRIASDDPIAVMEEGLRRYQSDVHGYQGTFSIREVLPDGSTVSAVCRFRFREKPFSVLLEWVQGARRIDKLLYVDGANDGQMIVHPTGLLGKLVGSVAVDPHGAEARKASSRPITAFGLKNALVRLLADYSRSRDDDSLRSQCLGLRTFGKAKVLTLRKDARGKRLVVDLDAARLLPVCIRQFDGKGQLVNCYAFADLRLNPAVDDDAFSKAANGL